MSGSPTFVLKNRFFQNLDLIGGFGSKPKIAVAVSGGVDSMALLWLAWQWIAAQGGHLTALTVDHRLRKESTDEAYWVHHHCQHHQINHQILTWQNPAQTGNILAQAREARYQLLQDYCLQKGIPHLLVAHQADDQLETFILHLERGSGLKGLSGMAPVMYLSCGRLLRPLLAEWRVDLQALLDEVGWGWREDPSNENLRYDRIKARKILYDLQQADMLTPSRWLTSLMALGQSQNYINQEIEKTMLDVVNLYPEGFATIDHHRIKTLAKVIFIEILAQTIAHIGGELYPPRWHQIEALWDFLGQKPTATRTTLGGCLIILKQKQIFICRELASIECFPQEKQDSNCFLWDNRFMIEGLENLPPCFIAPLGEKGWQALTDVDKTLKKLPYPQEVAMALPAVWQKTGEGLDILHAVPNLSFKTDKKWDKVTSQFNPKANLHRKKYLKLITPKSKEKD